MIIDFHTHVFPDKVAAKAIPFLASKSLTTPYTDGTFLGLSNSTKNANIDYSIALPVATAAKQVVSINDFAIGINNNIDNKNVISFGSMHPDFIEYKEELNRLKDNGIKGIKLHPAYQDVRIDDDRFVNIIDYAFSLGLIVIIHAGIDIGIPGDVHASPDRILACKSKLKNEGVFILAHMGSWKMWDEVYDKLLGKDFYIDTAFSLDEVYQGDNRIALMDYNEFVKFVNKHGANKILFGTDSPWANPIPYIKYIENSPISDKDKKLILGENAQRILNL